MTASSMAGSNDAAASRSRNRVPISSNSSTEPGLALAIAVQSSPVSDCEAICRRKASDVTQKPGGTGSPARIIRARFAPFPPVRVTSSASARSRKTTNGIEFAFSIFGRSADRSGVALTGMDCSDAAANSVGLPNHSQPRPMARRTTITPVDQIKPMANSTSAGAEE